MTPAHAGAAAYRWSVGMEVVAVAYLDDVDFREVGPLEVRVVLDPEPMDPREWDNLGTMLVADGGRYSLGDIQGTAEDIPDDAAVVLPLYLLDHSGLSMRTDPSGFAMCDSAGWDWGQVGVIYVDRETLTREGISEDSARTYLAGEVETYDKYLRGEVFGFVVQMDDETAEVLDSCWGFYDAEQAMMEGTVAAQCTRQYRDHERITAAQLAGIGL